MDTLLNDIWAWLTLEHVLRLALASAAAGLVFSVPFRLGLRFSRYLEDIEAGRRGWLR
jgi:hypothetical protein